MTARRGGGGGAGCAAAATEPRRREALATAWRRGRGTAGAAAPARKDGEAAAEDGGVPRERATGAGRGGEASWAAGAGHGLAGPRAARGTALTWRTAVGRAQRRGCVRPAADVSGGAAAILARVRVVFARDFGGRGVFIGRGS